MGIADRKSLAAGMALAACMAAWCLQAACGMRDVPKSWAPLKVNGREYWSYLTPCAYSDPTFEMKTPPCNPAFTNLAVFRDCAFHNAVRVPTPPGRPAWSRVVENYGKGGKDHILWRSLEANTRPWAPHIVRWATKRLVEAYAGKVELDIADHLAWRARHPEVYGLIMVDEWDNDMISLPDRISRVKDPDVKAKLVAEWGSVYPTNRYEYVKRARKFYDRSVELYAGFGDMVVAERACTSLDHMAAAWGARAIWVETTNTSSGDGEYRWDVAAPFIRGAGRQFQRPWGWFVAIFVNGFARDGTFHSNNVCWLRQNDNPEMKPWGGVSPSLERRCYYWAYVNGANFVEPEMWQMQYLYTGKDGVVQLSDRGRDFVAFHDFTRANPGRGTTYAPVAILVPFARGYPAYGGRAWQTCPYTPGDNQTDAVFFTLIPGFERAKGMKKGGEFNLHNSPYAMMHDVLVPDAPQKPEEFDAALAAYPVAILTGEYEDPASLKGAMTRYLAAGGTLVVGRANAAAVDVPPGGGAPVMDERGYEIAREHRVGKGRLFMSASEWMTPEFGDARRALAETLNGKRKFPEMAYFLRRFQRELFPVEVDGDVLYGLNVTPSGWWLWAFNNKGITNFTDEYPTLDANAKSDIRVRLRGISAKSARELVTGRDVALDGDTFSATVPAGDLAIFELERRGR